MLGKGTYIPPMLYGALKHSYQSRLWQVSRCGMHIGQHELQCQGASSVLLPATCAALSLLSLKAWERPAQPYREHAC